MKKLLIIAILLSLSMTRGIAQEVYKELRNNSKSIADDKSKDLETRKIATFKYDALGYMAIKVREEVMRDTTDLVFFGKMMRQLDEQSYAMHEFVSMFVSHLSATKKSTERDIVITIFRDASLNNPMYNDMDKDLVLAYYLNEGYLTQFSLDTDWVKALEAVRKRQ